MHPRNRHNAPYDFDRLVAAVPELGPFVVANEAGAPTIDYYRPEAVRALNRALLLNVYGVRFWELPEEFLCPPVPGRADYIHTVADLFPGRRDLTVFDVGVGANCIYPLLGNREYGWRFVGSDVSKRALENAQLIVDRNGLGGAIALRHQRDKTQTLTHVVRPGETFDLTICNPPFHESEDDARSGTERKWKNLGRTELADRRNFGGRSNELWYPGGERAFVLKLISESRSFAAQVGWFTTLVSKERNVLVFEKKLAELGAKVRILPLAHGQKRSRITAWRFPRP
jgi:23S rRNA (adenine1618-N6)-methyltransferase